MKILKNNSMNKPHYRGEILRCAAGLGPVMGAACDPRNIEFLLHGEVSLFIMNDHE